MHPRTVALSLLAVLGLACRDDVAGPGTVRRSAQHAAVAIACTANRTTSRVQCGAPSVARGATAAGAAREARARLEAGAGRAGGSRTMNTLTLGGQGDQIDLRVEDVRVGDGGDTMAVTMRLQNLLPVALGSIDGETPSLNLAAWVYDGPVVTAGAGIVSAVSADSAAEPLTSVRVPFFYFAPRPLPSYALSLPTLWRFVVPPTATEFVFRVLLLTELQDESAGAVPGDHSVNDIAAGARSSCFIRADQRKTYCWGAALGVGFARPTSSHLPTEVGGYQFTSLAAAGFGRCGVTPGGHAYCWGIMDFLLGGTALALPTPVFPGITVKTLAISRTYACALAADSTAWCMGLGYEGELGAGGTTNADTPVEVAGHLKWLQLSAGLFHACGLSRDSTAYCWGQNNKGQLGNGTIVNALIPTRVLAPFGWRSVSAGAFHSCGIASDGAGYCWGESGDGRLGDGRLFFSVQATPVPVFGARAWSEIAAGGQHTCGISNGSAFCWGLGSDGQLGNDGSASEPVPVDVFTSGPDTLHNFRLALEDPYHTCATRLHTDLAVCWGANSLGQLGTPGGPGATDANPINLPYGAQDISVGSEGTCALFNRVVSCWGRSEAGMSGTGDDGGDVLTPRAVLVGAPSNQVQVGSFSACARLTFSMTCWGENSFGQLANSDSVNGSAVPVPSAAGFNFDLIAIRADHGCGRPTGLFTLFCWGSNDRGQLGVAGPNSAIPIEVVLPVNVAQIATGSLNSCILDPAGFAYCWGDNQFGQVAGAAISGIPVYAPTLVSSSMRFFRIAIGYGTVCGIELFTRRLYCWGNNTYGQVGIGIADATPVVLPTAVHSLLQFEHITVANQHACATTVAGAAYCWGGNPAGQLGQLSSAVAFRYTPTRVPGETPFSKIVAGQDWTCAISFVGRSGVGEPWCWGLSSSTGHGQRFPDGEVHKVAMPSPVRRAFTG